MFITLASTPAVPQPAPYKPRQPIRKQKPAGMRAVITPSSAGEKPWIKVDNPEDNDAKKVKLFKELGAPDSDEEGGLQASSEVTEFSELSEKGEAQSGPVVEAMNAVLFPSENNGIQMEDEDGEEMVVAPPTEVSQVSIIAEEPLEPPTLVPQDMPNLVPQQIPPIEIIPQRQEGAVEEMSEPPQMDTIEQGVEQATTIETHMVTTSEDFVKEEDEDDRSPSSKSSIDPKAVVTGLKKRFSRK